MNRRDLLTGAAALAVSPVLPAPVLKAGEALMVEATGRHAIVHINLGVMRVVRVLDSIVLSGKVTV